MNKNQTVVSAIFKVLREEESEQHQKAVYKLKGWFRSKIKIKPHVYKRTGTERKGASKNWKVAGIMGKGIVSQVPGINMLWKAGGTAINIGFKVNTAIVDKAVKKLARKGLGWDQQAGGINALKAKGKLEDYTLEHGIKQMQHCHQKVVYAKGKLDSHKSLATCDDFHEFMAKLAWFDYRVMRLQLESSIVSEYVATFVDEVEKERKQIQSLVHDGLPMYMESTLLQSANHDKCEMCLVELRKSV